MTAAGLSILASLVALSRARRGSSLRLGAASRNSFDAQKTTAAATWNPNDQTNPNGMSAYSRRLDLDQPPRIWMGKLQAGQAVPGAGVGGPTGQLQ